MFVLVIIVKMTSAIINGSDNLNSSQLNIEYVNALFKNLLYHTKAQFKHQSCLKIQLIRLFHPILPNFYHICYDHLQCYQYIHLCCNLYDQHLIVFEHMSQRIHKIQVYLMMKIDNFHSLVQALSGIPTILDCILALDFYFLLIEIIR